MHPPHRHLLHLLIQADDGVIPTRHGAPGTLYRCRRGKGRVAKSPIWPAGSHQLKDLCRPSALRTRARHPAFQSLHPCPTVNASAEIITLAQGQSTLVIRCRYARHLDVVLWTSLALLSLGLCRIRPSVEEEGRRCQIDGRQ